MDRDRASKAGTSPGSSLLEENREPKCEIQKLSEACVMVPQSDRKILLDMDAGSPGEATDGRYCFLLLVATFLILFNPHPAPAQEHPGLAGPLEPHSVAKTSIDVQTASGTAYLEDGHLILEGTTVYIQKINPSTDDLFVDPTVTAHYRISEERDTQTGAEQLSGIRLHSGTKTIDVVLSCSTEGPLYKVYSNGQEVARMVFLAEARYSLQVSVNSEGVLARISEDGQEEELARLEYVQTLPNPAHIYFFLESKGESQETLRELDSVEILSESIQSDDTAVSRWRFHTP